jgi:hypothetical protein
MTPAASWTFRGLASAASVSARRIGDPVSADSAGLSARRVVALALGFAVLASTRYLLQPFVWRNWPVDEVLLGWLSVMGERIVVALAIAAAIVAALAVRQPLARAHPALHAAVYVLLVEAGAIGGEALLTWLAVPGAADHPFYWAARSLPWSVAAMAATGLQITWRRSMQAQSSMRQVQLARSQAEGQLASLRLQALQAQIEPHFLFNTLATARRLGSTEPAKGARLLEHLHEFVRLSRVGDAQITTWSVGEEIELARAYLGVVEMRFDGLLTVRFELDAAALHCEVPSLALATLIENAVKHGIAPSTRGGDIVVTARREAAVLTLTVADSGVGFQPGTSGTGIGLANTRARLRTLYGEQASLALAAQAPCGVVATLRLPAREGAA